MTAKTGQSHLPSSLAVSCSTKTGFQLDQQTELAHPEGPGAQNSREIGCGQG